MPGQGGGQGTAPADLVDRVKADAAGRANVGADQIRVVQVQDRDWPDGSLGCPEPGRMYTQAIVPGYFVLLADPAGRQYAYHTDRGARFVLCVGGRPA